MKFFDKSLEQIYRIVADINDKLYKQTDDASADVEPTVYVSFEFDSYKGTFRLNDQILFSTHNTLQRYVVEDDDYEDVKITLVRAINEKISEFHEIKSI